MDDLLSSQIRESCRLALPNGLKELMSDISREVLRFQPECLYDFIADYLSVLLVTRENLTVASRVFKELCCESCAPELKDELQHIGLDTDAVSVAHELIMEYFEGDDVPKNEVNLLMMLMNRITVDEVVLSQMQLAIRRAYLRHRKNRMIIYESSSESGKDEVECAVKHTLAVYRSTKPTETDYNQMSQKIQASYRAYGVTKQKQQRTKESPSSSKPTRKNITFDPTVNDGTWVHHQSLNSASSVSLAGSFVLLPKHVPYCAHKCDQLSELEELPEREHCNYDYTVHVNRESDPNSTLTIEDVIHDDDSDDVSGVVLVSNDDSESQASEVSEALVDDISNYVDVEGIHEEVSVDTEDESDDSE